MSEIQPILVSVDDARKMLGGLGRTNLYARLSSGELKSRKIGKRRLILVRSIVELIENAQG